MLKNREDAFALLRELNAPHKLIQHLTLVGEAGDELISALSSMNLKFDAQLVRLGISIHDAGKILHQDELSQAGSSHERAGEKLLLQHDVQSVIARCCVSHAQYMDMEVSLEELLVALAGKLWKGKRQQDLETMAINRISDALSLDKWEAFTKLDNIFEEIASKGHERLVRSRFKFREP